MICFFTDIKKAPSTEFKSLIRYGIFLSLVVLSSLVTLIILAPQFLERIILTDYRDLYASYEQSLSANFRYYGNSYGWLIWLLMLLGFSAGTLSRVMVRPVGFFIVSFGSISLIQWAISSKQLGPHYLTHFTFLIILGIAVLFWTILLQFKTRKSFVIVNIIILLLISNFLIGLTNIGKFNNLIRPLFATNTPPLVREDYEEVSNLIEYLREIVPNKEPIYVAGVPILNQSIIDQGERQLYGKNNKILNIIHGPIIDSRDFYPLEKLLRAKYIVVVPFPKNRKFQENDVVRFVIDNFTENLEFSQDFNRLPKEFTLQKGVTLSIYERISPNPENPVLYQINF